MRRRAEAFPVGYFVRDEMVARGWSSTVLALRMGGDVVKNELVVDMLLAVHDPNLILDETAAAGLARAFGTSKDYWLNLDRAWREWALSRPEIKGQG